MLQTHGSYMKENSKLMTKRTNQVVKHQHHFSGKFRGLAHNKCSLKTQKSHSSFVSILYHNFLTFDSYLIFEKLVNKTTEKGNEIKEDDWAKSTENYISVKLGSFKFLDSYSSLDASFDNLSTTITSFLSLDANGMKIELFKK